jgi:hypothetical protein
MTMAPTQVAVLTGDLVKSTEAGTGPTNAALDRVNGVAAIIRRWPGNGSGHFTRFRGDGWQILIPRPSLAFRALICVHAALRAAEDLPISRISIGIGSIDPITGKDLSDASGSALIASGQALDSLEKSRLFCVAGEGVTPLHHAVIDLVEEQMTRWTPEQAEATAYFLSPDTPTQKSIAETLQISVQAVHARLKGAGAQALRRAVEAWEAEDARHD